MDQAARLPQSDIKNNIADYLKCRISDHRYTSFDYCFNYFQEFRLARNTHQIADPGHQQLGCLHLGYYLASWGMFRGKADLLQKSFRHFVPVLEFIARTDAKDWEIDADNYDAENIDRLIKMRGDLNRIYPRTMSDTLATKIMLGVFGSVPAFDQNFRKGFGVHSFGKNNLNKIGGFYKKNSNLIDRFLVKTLGFSDDQEILITYTRAKVIDMAFFVAGGKKKAEKNATKPA